MRMKKGDKNKIYQLLELIYPDKSKELLDIINFANKNKIKSILVSCNKKSKLAQMSSHNLIIPNIKHKVCLKIIKTHV